MAELNLEDNILKLTLGDIVQSFSEEQLQTQMPIFMQDIDAETKDLIDTYQGYLVSGNFSEAETYRANNPALETRIWDAFKANSMMAYAAYTYLYAKSQNQQCVFSDTEPEGIETDENLGQVEGDIWYKIDSEANGRINVTPFVKQADGTYQELTFSSIYEMNSSIEIVIPSNSWTVGDNIYTYRAIANVSADKKYHWYMMPSNGIYTTDIDVETDFMLKGMSCENGAVTFYSSDNISRDITLIVEGVV